MWKPSEAICVTADRQVVQPTGMVPSSSATRAIPQVNIHGTYPESLPAPATVTGGYDRAYTSTNSFRFDNRVVGGDLNRRY